jgi:type IV secretory pathway VirB6-like protein
MSGLFYNLFNSGRFVINGLMLILVLFLTAGVYYSAGQFDSMRGGLPTDVSAAQRKAVNEQMFRDQREMLAARAEAQRQDDQSRYSNSRNPNDRAFGRATDDDYSDFGKPTTQLKTDSYSRDY